MKNPKVFVFIILSFLILTAININAASRTALVIGNGAYKSAPLKNPVNDAHDMAGLLQKLGFDVIEKIDADKRVMIKAVDTFGRKLHKTDVGIFFYAGHGIQIQGRNFLIPVDAKVTSASDVEFEGVHAGRILGKMEEAGNKLNIVILDACRDNPFKRSFRTAKKGLAKMDAPIGTIVAYATRAGSVAADGTGRNGVYTKHLLASLKNPGLSVQEVFTQTGLEVMKETRRKQVPWTSSTPVEKFFLAGESVIKEPPSAPESSDKKATNRQSGRLYVHVRPNDARVRIMNIVPKYHEGIELQPGRYHVRVDRKGYRTKDQWEIIQAGQDLEVSMALEKKQTVLTRQKAAQGLDSLLAKAEQERQQRQAAIKREKHRKDELKEKLEKYILLVENYGDQYKKQAWQALQNDFPLLTHGIASGDIDSLRVKAGINTWTDPVTGIEFVFVPGGCYQMGSSSSDADDDEKPVHEVCLDGFWIGRYEVTQGQWQKIMGSNPSYSKSGDNYPVENISWNDAKKFISVLNQQSGKTFSLPTEAQWEYAARSGGKDQKYSGGSDVDRFAWYSSNSNGKTHRVGTKASNGLGIYDMSGNVWEWCEDVYDGNAYSKHSSNNPWVSSGGSFRVSRGGGWGNVPRRVRCAYRSRYSASYTFDNLGFRLIRKN